VNGGKRVACYLADTTINLGMRHVQSVLTPPSYPISLPLL